ncbi:ABC transporter ATP-binding protein [Paenibacillus bouchesdurhonensis]|uniref:ABC transporter ATP-binding protein n=1 Tax=Paenibacillus bouchesdurhonensis TaxID=1870990 RepID=UPI0019013070|nr:ABC transporter ATP-binding protein [Paenibacillus bouchesdurhonensis]
MEPIVEAINLTKKIQGKDIIKCLNFKINPGEIIGFIGPNGSGKSTTMKMMMGLISITEGDVIVKGKSVKNNREAALVHMSGIIEYPEMYSFLSGFDNLVHFQRIRGSKNVNKIKQVVELLGLSKDIHHKFGIYSLGMKQRLGLANALLYSPDVIVLDEPTNGLDPEGIQETREYLKMIAKENGISIFISSHLLSEIELMCDRILIIREGEIRYDGPISEFLNESRNSKVRVVIKIDRKDYSSALELFQENVVDMNESHGLTISIPYHDIPLAVEQLVLNHVKVYSLTSQTESLEERFIKSSGGIK